jgi:hypothetical protein
MLEKFQCIIAALLGAKETEKDFAIFDPVEQFDEK